MTNDAYMMGEAKTANIERDVHIRDGIQITYKAVERDSRGFLFCEPIIMLQLSRNGCKSGWVDADHIANSVAEYRDSLIERIDSDFIPTNEWELE